MDGEGDAELPPDPLTDKYVPIQDSERGRQVWDILAAHYGISAAFPISQLLVRARSHVVA